jgi:replicative DNA helicase
MTQSFNENIEIQTLACLFKDGSLYPIVEDILERKAFGWKPFGTIFQSIKDVVDSDLYPDTETVATDLSRKGLLDSIKIQSNGKTGKDVLDFLKDLEVNVENLESYAYQVTELHAGRQLVSLAEDIKKGVESGKRPIEILSDMDLKSGKISAFVGAQSKNTRTSRDVAMSSIEQFEDASNGKSRYISTGLKAWDDYTNGLFPQRLYMVAARTNEGKSALIQNLINNISIENGIMVKLFSLEMSAEEIHNRLVQIRTGISPLKIETGKLKDSEIEPYKEATKVISNAPIIYDDSSELSLPLLRTKIRKAVSSGAKVILIDQLEQLTLGGSGDSQPEYIKVNYISYRLKAFSRELDVPVVIVHQMNRSGEGQQGASSSQEADPLLSQIAQGGEKACDAILIVRNNSKGTYFYWSKNRQGRKGKRVVQWDGTHIKFSDIAGLDEYPEFVQDQLASA